MEQQLKQCPKTGTYYYVDVPDKDDYQPEEVAEEVIEPPKPKMGRPKKR